MNHANQEQIDREQHANALLKTIQREEKGKLRIFLGAAPGVGKTYAMLSAARELQRQGIDVVVGLIETHGRQETEVLLNGLNVLPRKSFAYQGHTLTEFDLDGALARKPKVLLVDELAHTNMPGSRHQRRFQDIAELLEAGIDVYTTVNIQHVESLNDVVRQVTGVKVAETIPDDFLDQAQEIVFVDLPPSNLIERLQQGKIYLPEYAASALSSFFSTSNLTALREMAMQAAVQHVDANLQAEYKSRGIAPEVTVRDRVFVLISDSGNSEYLIRVGRRIATRKGLPWSVAWVDTGKIRDGSETAKLAEAFDLARDLGADAQMLRGQNTFKTVLEYIREQQISIVILGAGRQGPWWSALPGFTLYQRLLKSGLPLEVTVINPPQQTTHAMPRRERIWAQLERQFLRPHFLALLAIAFATVIGALLNELVGPGNISSVFIVAVIAVGVTLGLMPALTAATVGFLCFIYFLTEPHFTFTIKHHDDLVSVVFFFIAALICGPLASQFKRQVVLLKEANLYSETLRNLSQSLAVAEDQAAVWNAAAQNIGRSLNGQTLVVTRSVNGTLNLFPATSDTKSMQSPSSIYQELAPIDLSAVEWALKHHQPAGKFTDTLGAAKWYAHPIMVEEKTIAILLLRFNDQHEKLMPSHQHLIESMSRQITGAALRVELVTELESARVKGEVEQLRSALLSSVSHDLRSPLSAMIGAADSLRALYQQLDSHDREELIDTILSESRRLDRYIQNLLDMTRLGHGTLKIERDWVSLGDIVGSVVNRMKRYFPEVQVQHHLAPEIGLLYVHPALIEQALFNILENAARYSPAGEPVVIAAEQDKSDLVINVTDRGPGIPADLREKIFDMFYSVEGGDRKQQNVGLGLAICRGMIGAHGGSVHAFDGPDGRGITISVRLPL